MQVCYMVFILRLPIDSYQTAKIQKTFELWIQYSRKIKIGFWERRGM